MASNQLKTQNENIEVWQSKVLDWFSTRRQNNSLGSNEQLYLWGPTCTGKTRFIMHLLENEQIFCPVSSHCRELNECMDKYSIALIDEFSGKLKEVAQIQKQLQMPMILISNFEPSSKELKKLNGNKCLNLCAIQVE